MFCLFLPRSPGVIWGIFEKKSRKVYHFCLHLVTIKGSDWFKEPFLKHIKLILSCKNWGYSFRETSPVFPCACMTTHLWLLPGEEGYRSFIVWCVAVRPIKIYKVVYCIKSNILFLNCWFWLALLSVCISSKELIHSFSVWGTCSAWAIGLVWWGEMAIWFTVLHILPPTVLQHRKFPVVRNLVFCQLALWRLGLVGRYRGRATVQLGGSDHCTRRNFNSAVERIKKTLNLLGSDM